MGRYDGGDMCPSMLAFNPAGSDTHSRVYISWLSKDECLHLETDGYLVQSELCTYIVYLCQCDASNFFLVPAPRILREEKGP